MKSKGLKIIVISQLFMKEEKSVVNADPDLGESNLICAYNSAFRFCVYVVLLQVLSFGGCG